MNKGQREQSLFFVDVNDHVDKFNNDVNKDGYEMYLTKVIWEEHVSLFFVMIVQQQKIVQQQPLLVSSRGSSRQTRQDRMHHRKKSVFYKNC